MATDKGNNKLMNVLCEDGFTMSLADGCLITLCMLHINIDIFIQSINKLLEGMNPRLG